MGDLIRLPGSQNLVTRITSDLRNIMSLTLGLARDPRVPKRNKMIFSGVVAYVLMPVDLVPDWLPGIGRLDDIIMVCLAIDAMVNHVPEGVIDEYWKGDRTTLDIIRRTANTGTEFLPSQLVKTLYPAELR